MTRDEAIDLLAQQELTGLPVEKRESLLLDWWSIDADDPDYETLPDDIKDVLKRLDEPDDPSALPMIPCC